MMFKKIATFYEHVIYIVHGLRWGWAGEMIAEQHYHASEQDKKWSMFDVRHQFSSAH